MRNDVFLHCLILNLAGSVLLAFYCKDFFVFCAIYALASSITLAIRCK